MLEGVAVNEAIWPSQIVIEFTETDGVGFIVTVPVAD
jgi:hypothetical protein